MTSRIAAEAPFRRMRNRTLLALLVLMGPAHKACAAGAQIRNTYGEVGLLDMPSAHMVDDGELALTASAIEHTQRLSLSFQATPWLEGSFRYSHIAPGAQLYDRSFSLKMRLLSEEKNFADLSVGVRDLLGTGTYSSEYLALSKHLGPLDFTAGLGWGRLSDAGELPNPLGYIFPSLKTRGQSTSSTGNTLDLNEYFSGPRVGIFGGAAWQTPVDGLSLIAEYSSDKYTRERSQSPKSFAVRSPVNLGLSYRLENLSIGAGWYYGSTYGVTLSLNADPKSEMPTSARIGPPIPEARIRTDFQQSSAIALLSGRNGHLYEQDRSSLDLKQAVLAFGEGARDAELQGATLIVDARRVGSDNVQCKNFASIASGSGSTVKTVALSDLQDGDGHVTFCAMPSIASPESITSGFNRELRAALRQQGIDLEAVEAINGEIWIYYTNNRYRDESEAAGRIIRALMYTAAPSVEIFHIFPLINGKPSQEIRVTRSALERTISASGVAEEAGPAFTLTLAPLNNPVLRNAISADYPIFSWSAFPVLSQQFFDPNRPLGLRLTAEALAGVQLAPGLALNTDVSLRLWDNFNLSRPSDSLLPHVRTDVVKYLKDGANGISTLLLEYQTRIAPDVFVDVKAGYLEDMFAGAGAQILWRPQGSRFALGADAYQVWQRNFDRLFGLQDYHILTGHVSIYYDSPWYGLNFAVHAGEYLAGDRGITFEIRRQFSTGVEVGAYATLTNVPFATFGEGSFDKGIYIHIPLEWALPVFTQTAYNLNLRSLTRNGGQRLVNDDSLYDITRRDSYNELNANMDELVNP